MSDLEELENGPPTTEVGSGGDRERGITSGGYRIGAPLAGGDAPAPKRRGRPPSSARLSGGDVALAGGATAAAQSYLGAAGIRPRQGPTTNGDTGGGNREADGEGRGGGEGTGLFREAPWRAQTPQPIPLPVSGVKRGRPKKVDVSTVKEETVAHAVVAVFGAVAVLTTHKHWQKTTERVAPISEPLTEWINSLDPHTVDILQKYLLPVSVLTGIVAVATPDIMVEIEFRKLRREAARIGMPAGPPRMPATPPPVARAVNQPGEAPGANGGAIVPPPEDL